ncbi:hypothetical protein [Ochrobactrum sp. S1502_03]|uniref:hypothetical protein n=1 Tax=Ochrobactrum sp. S1502_03 TaxID=3108451 RepID=UPI0037C66D13
MMKIVHSRLKAAYEAREEVVATLTAQDDLAGFPLKDVHNDTRTRGFCGPTAVAAITGHPISLVKDAFRYARHGSGWLNFDRAPAIMGTQNYEVETVMSVFGFAGQWQKIGGDPTLAAYLDNRFGFLRTHPTIICVTNHYVAVSGWEFCDTKSKGLVVDASEAPGRRKRVKEVFIVTGRTEPMRNIPRKHY